MAKTFLSVGKTTTESINPDQPVWVLIPETVLPCVVSTYARQVYPGTRVLVRLGSVSNLFSQHFLPHLNSSGDQSLEQRKREYVTVSADVAAFAGDLHKRAQLFISFLSTAHLIDRKLYPLVEKIRQHSPLTGKDISPLVDVLYTKLRKSAGATAAHKQKLRDYIQSGVYDDALILWLARFVNPVIALHLQQDRLKSALNGADLEDKPKDHAAAERELRQAIEQISAGGACPQSVCGVGLENWLAEIIGCAPQQRFFAAACAAYQGLNKTGCLNFDRSKHFHDFGETAPRFIALDKLSRVVTAFDRTLSHLVIKFAVEDAGMKELCEHHPVHSGILVRGLLGDNDAMRTLYPTHTMTPPNQPELHQRLIDKTLEAIEDGSLARVCAPHYNLSESDLEHGLKRVLTIHRKVLPLVPMEVHRLVDAIETRIRLRKAAEKLEASGGRATNRQQAIQLDVAMRAQSARQFELGKTLKADFHVDPANLFYIDNLLIDRSKAIFGNDLEFMRPILAGYIERRQAAQQSASATSGSVINS